MIRLESQHEIAFPREAVWPVVSNTDWLNRSLGLPPVEYQTTARPEGGSWVTGQARMLGRQMRWRELPFEWLEPEFYRVRRVFDTGPFEEARLGLELQEQPGGKTRLVAYSELEPRSLSGRWLARKVLGPKAERDMRRIAAHVEEFLRGREKAPVPKLAVQPVNEMALQAGVAKLQESRQPAALIGKLEEMLREAPDVELSHLRPLAVARRWAADGWDVVRLFLHSTRSGLLDLRWEVLCPNCRSTRQAPARSLQQLAGTAHCDGCQIQFDAEFDKSVELKFSVNPAVRRPEEQTFCLAGPGGQPHVLSQLWSGPQGERMWKLPAASSLVRLRSPQVKASLMWPAELAGPGQQIVIICEAAKFLLRAEPATAPAGHARVVNPNPFPVLLRFEQVAWSADILTAARATNWQEFRDLFSQEVIAPGEQISVGSQVILFTDLRGSTAMYQAMGDPRAYALVRRHFTVLAEAVRAHHGTLVKTIGDAVMASFSRVDEALAAVREMHQALSPGTAVPGDALTLKSGLHAGPCLAVNANDRLDYFGTTVNLAARMVSCCQGGDVAVSEELYRRPETAAFLATCPKPAERSQVRFRGFDFGHEVWRIPLVALER